MNAFQVLRKIGPFDIKNIGRDSLLNWMVIMPLLIALMLRLAMPPLITLIQEELAFDLTPYMAPIVGGYFLVLFTPVLFGIVIGFLMLDERDDRTLLALRITPMPLTSYLTYRLAIPMLIGAAMTLITFPLANLAQLPVGTLLIVALFAAFEAPVFALFLASFGENKVQGFAIMKGTGPILVGPMLAYFIPATWPGFVEYLFALLPTYWPVKLYWSLIEPGMHGPPALWAAGTVVYHVALLALLLRRFNTMMDRLN
ncbi:MAG: hypothetical protein ACFB51_10435 [Anaerolineae bacterium]